MEGASERIRIRLVASGMVVTFLFVFILKRRASRQIILGHWPWPYRVGWRGGHRTVADRRGRLEIDGIWFLIGFNRLGWFLGERVAE